MKTTTVTTIQGIFDREKYNAELSVQSIDYQLNEIYAIVEKIQSEQDDTTVVEIKSGDTNTTQEERKLATLLFRLTKLSAMCIVTAHRCFKELSRKQLKVKVKYLQGQVISGFIFKGLSIAGSRIKILRFSFTSTPTSNDTDKSRSNGLSSDSQSASDHCKSHK